MATKVVRRHTNRPERSVYARPAGGPSKTVCAFWAAGRCTREFCRFLHADAPPSSMNPQISKKSSLVWTKEATATGKGNACNATQKSNAAQTQKSNAPHESNAPQKSNAAQKSNPTPKSVCKFWVDGNCVKGDRCLYLHNWFRGEGFSMLAKLQGHTKVFLILEVWNTETNSEFNLDGPVGQVHAMVVGNEMLFAGTQNGDICVWKGSTETNTPFYPAATLKGHTGAVVCLTVGRNRLYSGSVDHTIKVWDLYTLQGVLTLNGHSGAVMSLLCWDQFLLSCSLDDTIKVWAATEGGGLEVTYTHNEEQGVLDLAGMTDAEESKPILLSSCNDNSVRIYELPSFTGRGRLFAKQEVRTVEAGPGGLFFSGDATGLLSVWKWMDPPAVKVESS
ncbi:zinc finger CCCH domain-containing protein 48 [Prunus yedoensis var. nudiflora]|uniref:Zinc finger CCCH domain-containing protein 48 n=1 Tax=Prunus yedoensis var. nudiflora TaxID=2094558 RepID=A0A314XTQ6_PRUYE|nr:zinc finger CCCH domain-containing protein 48 [Prunus yedoensis var. nudiflora]